MTAARHLRSVPPEPPLDINLAIRADIQARDWDAVHIACQRRQPINLPELVRRVWRR